MKTSSAATELSSSLESSSSLPLPYVEAAFNFAVKLGSGILMRHDKKNKKWSPPCAIDIKGVGAGLHAGIEKKDIVLFLTEPYVVKSLSREFQLRIGPRTGITFSPKGHKEISNSHFSHKRISLMASFAHPKRFYIGISLEGATFCSKDKSKHDLKWSQGLPKKISFGEVNVPNHGGV